MSKHAKQPSWMRFLESPLGRRSLIYMGLFTLLIPYYETVFNLTTANTLFTSDAKSAPFIMLLFSMAYSLVAYLIISCIPNRRANYIVSIILISILALPYLVEFYIFKGFGGQFYGFTTAKDGAADMLDGYLKETFVAIFKHFYGLILFALPAVLFGIFGRGLYVKKKPIPANLGTRCLAVVMAVLCYSSGLLVINGTKEDAQN